MALLCQRPVIPVAARDRKVGYSDVVEVGCLGVRVHVDQDEAVVPLLARAIGRTTLVPCAHLVPLVCAKHRIELAPDDVAVMVPVDAWHSHVAPVREVVAKHGVKVHLVVVGHPLLQLALGEGSQVGFGVVVNLKLLQAQELADREAVQVCQH